MQTFLKLLLSLGLLATAAGALYGLYRLWTGNVNVEGVASYLRQRAEEHAPTLLRDEDALYQAGAIVARVHGATIDEAKNLVHFDQLTGTINFLNPGPAPVIFRRHQIRCTKIDQMTGVPPTPYLYTDVTCTVVGPA